MKCKVQIMKEINVEVDEKYRVLTDISTCCAENALLDELIGLLSVATGLEAFDDEAIDKGKETILGVYDEYYNAIAEW